MGFLQYLIAPISGGFYFVLNRVLGRNAREAKRLSLQIIHDFGKTIVDTKGLRIPSGFQISILISAIAKEKNLKENFFYTPLEILNGLWKFVETTPGITQKIKVKILQEIEWKIKMWEDNDDPNDPNAKPPTPLLPAPPPIGGSAKIIKMRVNYRRRRNKNKRNSLSKFLNPLLIILNIFLLLNILFQKLENWRLLLFTFDFIFILIGIIISKKQSYLNKKKLIELKVRRMVLVDSILKSSIKKNYQIIQEEENKRLLFVVNGIKVKEIDIINSPFKNTNYPFLLKNLVNRILILVLKLERIIYRKERKKVNSIRIVNERDTFVLIEKDKSIIRTNSIIEIIKFLNEEDK